MRTWRIWRRIAALACGSAFFLDGCDENISSTVEDGLITTSTSLFASFLSALVDLAEEAQEAESAQLILDTVQSFLA